MLPDKLPMLDVSIGAMRQAGQLVKGSTYEFRYIDPTPDQPSVSLLMPPRAKLTWQSGDLFPSMDQNLPEGDLFMRIRQLFPKQPTTPMHLLALIGENGIGRLGFRMPGVLPTPRAQTLSRDSLLRMRYTPELFDELVRAYLHTGAGIAGMQPKIMVPDRPTIPIPSLIVKAASPAYPGLAANEFLCLSAAKRAGIEVPGFDLSDDGQLLLVDRFDVVSHPGGAVERLGFEDVAALSGKRVRDILSDRKYHGSYQRISELLQLIRLPSSEQRRFFEQVAFSVMVRNGDAHLKNFGVLYRSADDAWLAPMFDVVTTAVYRYTQYAGGPVLEDRTMALKLLAGRHSKKGYPTTEELIAFGRICGVDDPKPVLSRIAAAMSETLRLAPTDARVPKPLLQDLASAWEEGLMHGR